MKVLNPARKSRRVQKGLRPAVKETRSTLDKLLVVLGDHIKARELGRADWTTAKIYMEQNGHWSYET